MHSPKSSALPRLLAFGLLAFGVLAPVRAELVVLVDGSVMKVATFEAEGDFARLTYPEGGRITMAIDRVERVVDDEWTPPPPEPPPAVEAVAEAVNTTAVPLRFEEAQAKVPEGPYGDLIFETARRHKVNP